MTKPIRVTVEERDLLYDRILVHLSGIDAVWIAADQGDFATADRLGREFCEELHLVIDDLGWGEHHADEPIELTTSPDVVRRVVTRIRQLAEAESAHEELERQAMKEAEAEQERLRRTCERILAAVDD